MPMKPMNAISIMPAIMKVMPNPCSGLGIFEYIFCPHYQKDGILQFNQDIKKYNYSGYALTNGALLKIKNNHYQIIKEKGAEAFYLDKDNDYILKYLKKGAVKKLGF